jgi:hypothetical protein
MTEKAALKALVKAIKTEIPQLCPSQHALIRIAIRDAERVLAGLPTTARGLRRIAAKKEPRP